MGFYFQNSKFYQAYRLRSHRQCLALKKTCAWFWFPNQTDNRPSNSEKLWMILTLAYLVHILSNFVQKYSTRPPTYYSAERWATPPADSLQSASFISSSPFSDFHIFHPTQTIGFPLEAFPYNASQTDDATMTVEAKWCQACPGLTQNNTRQNGGTEQTGAATTGWPQRTHWHTPRLSFAGRKNEANFFRCLLWN